MPKRKLVAVDTTVADAVNTLFSTAEELKGELESWLENLPESLQNGSKADELQEAIDALEEIAEPEIPEPFASLKVEFQTAPLKANASRSQRLSDAQAYASMAKDVIEQWVEDNEKEDHDVAEQLCSEIQEMLDGADNVSFPGMR